MWIVSLTKSAFSGSSNASSKVTSTSPTEGSSFGFRYTQLRAISTYSIKHTGAIFPFRNGSIIS
ncbi:hypothetical protein SLEP1_g10522 [Rubroshorea leprosula]|uniref:Uncharacterized protein n=1 Tax=Rubroshorea leprosula TaxID=152421 RepID=A0AAV5I8D0_9ROSI|nr:hypothetical protein SLEP1_g10522 [Rubroshorea leprosula]